MSVRDLVDRDSVREQVLEIQNCYVRSVDLVSDISAVRLSRIDQILPVDVRIRVVSASQLSLETWTVSEVLNVELTAMSQID